MKNKIKYKEDFSDRLKKRAIFEGFAVSGIASIPGSSRLKLRTKALERWLANNYHSEMKWMEAERRKSIESLLSGAKSVLTVGFNYLSEEHKEKTKFKIGKFGQGEDYHKVINKKLKKIYPKKKKDKNFIIKKLIIKNSNANVISKELKINTKTKLSNMEFLNVGNSNRANHFKDVFAMILTNVISKVQNDILTQKIQQKFQNKLKNLKQDILKDLLKESPKDLLKKFDKLFK